MSDQIEETEQLTRDDLARMTKDGRHLEISAARADGRLARLLGVPETEIALLARAKTGVLDIEDVHALTEINRHDLIEAARATNRINHNSKDN
jgi:hypothetical protein